MLRYLGVFYLGLASFALARAVGLPAWASSPMECAFGVAVNVMLGVSFLTAKRA